MPNLTVVLNDSAVSGTVVSFVTSLLLDTGEKENCVLDLDLSVLSGNTSQINTAIANVGKEWMLTNRGITIGAGDKVTIFGGAV